MKTLTFFNNKGGVGKTSLVYHLAWMLAEMGHRVAAIDLDPQSNLTSAFMEEDELETIWETGDSRNTVLGCLRPLIMRLGDIENPVVRRVTGKIGLIPGDLGLSLFEDRLGEAWGKCLDDNQPTAADAFRVTTAFFRIMRRASEDFGAKIVLIDVGPNLGALNRVALVATDYVVVPLAADLFSLHGLRNLGPTLAQWRKGWTTRRKLVVELPEQDVPSGEMRPIGYVVMQPSMRERYPVNAYRKWINRIPEVYADEVSHLKGKPGDSSELATLKNYRSLAPLAQDARKPMFLLRASDGAIGGHATAVRNCYEDFHALASKVLARVEID